MRDALAREWINYLESLAITPILVPSALGDPVAYVRELRVDGVILTGGNDIDLAGDGAWGRDVDPERDRAERALIEFARCENLPLLGVCRGFQFINQYFGGGLTPAVTNTPGIGCHVAVDHSANIEIDSWARLSDSDTLLVNSFHSDGVVREQLASVLVVSASSDAGKLVEGFIHPTERIAGVQWHPERNSPNDNFNKKLFRAMFLR